MYQLNICTHKRKIKRFYNHVKIFVPILPILMTYYNQVKDDINS